MTYFDDTYKVHVRVRFNNSPKWVSGRERTFYITYEDIKEFRRLIKLRNPKATVSIISTIENGDAHLDALIAYDLKDNIEVLEAIANFK